MLKENWYALFICLISDEEVPIDKALIKMGKQEDCKISKIKYSQSEINYINKLKDSGKSYTQIGIMLGLTRSQVAGIVRQYRLKAARTPTKVVQAAI